jgi:prepilin-type N-terminal cleavage/methylation domain-containing protein
MLKKKLAAFTLIEVLVSLFIVSVSFSSLLVLSQHQLKLSQLHLDKAYQQALERVKAE